MSMGCTGTGWMRHLELFPLHFFPVEKQTHKHHQFTDWDYFSRDHIILQVSQFSSSATGRDFWQHIEGSGVNYPCHSWGQGHLINRNQLLSWVDQKENVSHIKFTPHFSSVTTSPLYCLANFAHPCKIPLNSQITQSTSQVVEGGDGCRESSYGVFRTDLEERAVEQLPLHTQRACKHQTVTWLCWEFSVPFPSMVTQKFHAWHKKTLSMYSTPQQCNRSCNIWAKTQTQWPPRISSRTICPDFIMAKHCMSPAPHPQQLIQNIWENILLQQLPPSYILFEISIYLVLGRFRFLHITAFSRSIFLLVFFSFLHLILITLFLPGALRCFAVLLFSRLLPGRVLAVRMPALPWLCLFLSLRSPR